MEVGYSIGEPTMEARDEVKEVDRKEVKGVAI